MNFNIHNSQGNLQFKEIQTSEETKHYEGLYVYKNIYKTIDYTGCCTICYTI